MSLDPERRPMVLPVFAWFGVADWLQVGGDGTLAGAIRAAMQGRRLGEEVVVDLTDDERERVMAVLTG